MIRLALATVLIAVAYSMATYNPVLHKVQDGTKQLICNDKVVPKERVIDFVDGTWIFDNGYAKNCEVK